MGSSKSQEVCSEFGYWDSEASALWQPSFVRVDELE